MDNKNDLTQGPIIQKLIIFFLPIAAGMIFQQLYNAVDALVVGKCIGTTALAAVGGTPAVLNNVIIGFCNSLAGGSAVVIAQYFGGKDYKRLKSSVQTSYIFCTVLGILVGSIVAVFSPQILVLLKTPADTYELALVYQRIFFGGCVFMLLYNMGAGILRAVGDSKFPFLCLFIGCGVNIVLDILFVAIFDWGVAGVGWATVFSQVLSVVLVTIKLSVTASEYQLSFKENLFSFRILGNMMRIGLPAGVQAVFYGISNVILQVGVNTLGSTVVASWTMSGKVDGIYWSVTNAFGMAITAFIGQNYGAGHIDRIKECTKRGTRMFLLVTVALSTLILVVSMPVLNILSDDAAVITTTYKILWFFVPTYVTWSIIEIYSGVLRGVGDSLIPSILIAVGICAVRILWASIVFTAYHTLEVLCISYPLSWFITDILLLVYYKKYSVVAKSQELKA